MTETQLQRQIIEALARIGYWVMRINAGRSGGVQMAPAGFPDLLVLAPKHGLLEVKLPTGKLTQSQVAFHARCRRRGVRVAVVRSVADALDTVTKEWA